jgi:hypothetical protein
VEAATVTVGRSYLECGEKKGAINSMEEIDATHTDGADRISMITIFQ